MELLHLSAYCSCSWFCLLCAAEGDDGAGRWMRVFPGMLQSSLWLQWDQCPELWALGSHWWAALFVWMQFPPQAWPLICEVFIHWESDSVKTPQKPICSKVESFPISICFLCKCMWWPWSHLNPCAHLTCSLVLFFWRIRSKIKSLFEDYWKGIPHVSVCVHRPFILEHNLTKIKWT